MVTTERAGQTGRWFESPNSLSSLRGVLPRDLGIISRQVGRQSFSPERWRRVSWCLAIVWGGEQDTIGVLVSPQGLFNP